MIQFSKTIEHIKSDNQAGSGEILNRTIQALQVYLKRAEGNDATIKSNLILVLKDLLETFGAMSVLFHFINNLFLVIETKPQNQTLSIHLLDFIRDYQHKWEAVAQNLVQNAFNTIDFQGKSVLVHSNSHTVTQLFTFLKNQGVELSIIQTESRPAYEGVVQGKNLADLGYRIKLITDSNISRYLEHVDLAIVGADSVFENSFINKVGTYLIALACQDFGTSMYVLADSRKFLPRSINIKTYQEHPKPEVEILEENHPNLEPENFYFEELPNNLATAFITEKKAITAMETHELISGHKISSFLL